MSNTETGRQRSARWTRWALLAGAALAGCAAETPALDTRAAMDAGARDAIDGAAPLDASAADAALDAHVTLDASAALDAGSADAAALDAGSSDAAAGPDAAGAAIIPVEARCAPTLAACDAPRVDAAAIHAALRRDPWLPEYSEDTPVPEHGGRVQVVATAAIGGRITRVRIDGTELSSIESPPASSAVPPFEWWHVWPERAVRGEPVWVSFHTRDARWDTRTSAELSIETATGVVASGTFSIARPDAPITYVTTTLERDALLVHLANESSAPRTLERLIVDGRDVTESACIATRTLAPGEHTLVRVPRCELAEPGDAWSVIVEWADADDAVGVGRVLPPFFPIEAWNSTTDCPFPGGDEDALAMHREALIDTLYIHGGVCDRCGGCDTATLLGETLPAAGLHAIATSDLSRLSLTSTAAVAAYSTGDESDGELYRDDGTPEAAHRARDSQRAWWRRPEVPTFNGAMTNRNVGTFAGMADVQGIDLYVAACAPHITPFLMHPPLRAPFDYLRNARLAQRPGPVWLYAQGLSPVWNRGDPEYSVQPDPPELAAQAMMAVAAGAKGLMWFQSNVGEGEHARARWRAIGDVNAMVSTVRELLRSGDPIGARTRDAALVEAIRAERAIVVPVASLSTSSGPDDLRCLAVRSESSVPHWVFRASRVAADIDVPAELGVLRVLEVAPDGVRRASDVEVSARGRTLSLTGIALDPAFPVRLFVLAADDALEGELSAAWETRAAARAGEGS